MDINQFAQIVADQRLEVESMDISSLCHRGEESLIDLDSSLAQIVIGVRRSGKSTLCHKVLSEKGINYAYLNFDDERLFKLASDELNLLLEALYMVYGDFEYLFLDEIQNIDEWFLFVNRLLRQKIRIVITGSNAKLLSSELATHLTGRYNQIELYPFSFLEYCEYKCIDTNDISTKGRGLVKGALEQYLKNGGFPELFGSKNRRNYIQALLNSIIKRDIQQRFKVKYSQALSMIANHLMDNLGQEIIYSSLAKKFGLGSAHTAENYVSYLKQAYLVLGIHKFSYKSKERIRSEKAYLVDLAFAGERADAMMGENLGWRLENMVYVEILRRTKPLFMDVYYYRDRYEIDFVICDGNRVVELIQVSLDISSKRTYNREINSLIKGSTALNCSKLTLITLTENREVEESERKISIVSIDNWLINRSIV